MQLEITHNAVAFSYTHISKESHCCNSAIGTELLFNISQVTPIARV